MDYEVANMTSYTPRHVPGMTLVTARVIAPGCGALVVSIDELFEQGEPNAVLAWLEMGKLQSIAVEWNACSVAVRPSPSPSALYLGEFGEIVRFDGSSFHEQARIAGVEQQGPLRSIKEIDPQYTIAVGTALQVYRSGDWVSWTPERIPILASESLADLGIESICGFSANEAYAVGWDGLLCCRRRSGWYRIDSPTNVDLYDVICADDGFVYACGDEGTLLKGRENSWKLLEQEVTREKLWGLTYFAGRIFISSMHLLYELIDDQLMVVAAPDDGLFPSSTYRLSTAGGVLWSAGTKELYEFDGERWTLLVSFFD